MKKLILIISCCFLGVYGNAQYNNQFFEDTIQRLTISSEVYYNYGSNVMNNEMLNKFVFGGKIDKTIKNDVYNNLSNNNRLGGDLEYHLNVAIPFDTLAGKTNISLVVGLSQKEHADSKFSSDLFRFTFDGNKQFAGKTINIGNTDFSYFKYQQMNIGFISHKKKQGKMATEGAIVSFIKAEEHFAITVPRGSLFTEEYGREIDLDINYLYNTSDTAKKGFGAWNGFGVSTELFSQFFLKNGDKIHLGIKDLGFIQWNKQSLKYETDSLFHFEGIIVNNIFDLNDSLLSDISKDSLINSINTTQEKGSYSMALPTSFTIDYTKYINDKWQFNGGIYYRILANYFPLFYTNTSYFVSQNFITRAHVSYGGYGKLNLGLALAYQLKNSYTLFLGSNNIDAFISPSTSFANSGFVGIKAQF
ncbi:MAG: hypothetical protein CVT95_01740 [Bacteroidetes bacterium HGW-Bacteroidetes-12]|nr:MAG: hypothetical protein CVT95_01740 [Bacteroidetes bacterium HGW-Bacteroidetes-12]